MICYEVNATYLPSGDLSWSERFRQIAEAGFTTVEVLFPQRQDQDELEALLQTYHLDLALIDTESDPDNPRGHLSIPGAEERFWFRFNEALGIARRLGARRINVLGGLRVPEVSVEEQTAIMVDRLQRAAPIAAADGIMILFEGLNTRDNPGFFMTHSQNGFAVVDAVGEPNVRFQYDFYHMQIMEGDLTETFRKNVDKIGHIQVADPPARLAPGTGEINYASVLRAVEESTYHGYIGLEYRPHPDGRDPFSWLAPEKRGRRLT